MDCKQRFRSMKKTSGDTQDSHAERAGVSRKYIRELEGTKPEFNPTLDVLPALTEACDENLGSFLFADDSDDPAIATAISQLRSVMEAGGQWKVACERVVRSLSKTCAEESNPEVTPDYSTIVIGVLRHLAKPGPAWSS